MANDSAPPVPQTTGEAMIDEFEQAVMVRTRHPLDGAANIRYHMAIEALRAALSAPPVATGEQTRVMELERALADTVAAIADYYGTLSKIGDQKIPASVVAGRVQSISWISRNVRTPEHEGGSVATGEALRSLLDHLEEQAADAYRERVDDADNSVPWADGVRHATFSIRDHFRNVAGLIAPVAQPEQQSQEPLEFGRSYTFVLHMNGDELSVNGTKIGPWVGIPGEFEAVRWQPFWGVNSEDVPDEQPAVHPGDTQQSPENDFEGACLAPRITPTHGFQFCVRHGGHDGEHDFGDTQQEPKL